MSEHYYTPQPSAEHRPATVRFTYRGHELTLETDSGVFSRTELDKGTKILLDALPPTLTGRVLDMGCGYGPIGIAVKLVNPGCTVTMADVNERALGLAKQNAASCHVPCETVPSDGFGALQGRAFDTVITNPPIRAGKAVIYQMFSDAHAALTDGGRLYIVIRKQQGAPSALSYLGQLFGKAEVIEKESGYWIIQSTKGTPE